MDISETELKDKRFIRAEFNVEYLNVNEDIGEVKSGGEVERENSNAVYGSNHIPYPTLPHG